MNIFKAFHNFAHSKMALEMLFETYTICKVLIITESDEDTVAFHRTMREDMDIDAVYVLMDHIDDERPLHILRFASMGRCICMSVAVFRRIAPEIEHLMRNINIVYFVNAESQYVYGCIELLQGLQRRGLIPLNCIVATSDYFLRNMIELTK